MGIKKEGLNAVLEITKAIKSLQGFKFPIREHKIFPIFYDFSCYKIFKNRVFKLKIFFISLAMLNF